jgi:hypothetical protein
MTGLMAVTDKVLREAGMFRAQDARAQTRQAEMLTRFLDAPGLRGPGAPAAGAPAPLPLKTLPAGSGGKVLCELRALLDSFSVQARQRLVADIRSALSRLNS